jgi:alcohol dehydrogenase class IV
MNNRCITLSQPPLLLLGCGSLEKFFSELQAMRHKRLYLLTIPVLKERLQAHLEQLAVSGIETEADVRITSEPTFAVFEEILASARLFKADAVVGIGGGSVLDTAKLLAAQLRNNQDTRSVTGIGLLKERRTYLACVPTTSGTGSEVSPNAIFLDETDHEKKAVISPFLVPDAVCIDPELMLELPSAVTAYTGVDAFSHCLEAFVNRFAHPLTDGLALEGMRLIFTHLERACRDGQDKEARTALAIGSLYGGMCLGPVNTAAVHALAYPLGSRYKTAHGLSIALLLPYVLDFNLPAAESRLARIARAIGVTDGGPEKASAQACVSAIRQWLCDLGIPGRLSAIGIKDGALEEMAASAMNVQRLLQNNVRDLSFDDALDIYKKAF